MSSDRGFEQLEAYLASVPGISPPVGHRHDPEGRWWVKFSIDIDHLLAWHVVQELEHVLNYLSLTEKLPTTFKPVSPPPYLNGARGPFSRGSSNAPTLGSRRPRSPSGSRAVSRGPSATSSNGRETTDTHGSRPQPTRVLESPACASSTASA